MFRNHPRFVWEGMADVAVSLYNIIMYVNKVVLFEAFRKPFHMGVPSLQYDRRASDSQLFRARGRAFWWVFVHRLFKYVVSGPRARTHYTHSHVRVGGSRRSTRGLFDETVVIPALITNNNSDINNKNNNNSNVKRAVRDVCRIECFSTSKSPTGARE